MAAWNAAVGERVAVLRLEGELLAALAHVRRRRSGVLAVRAATDALHSGAPRLPAAPVDEDPQPGLEHRQRPEPLADAAPAGLVSARSVPAAAARRSRRGTGPAGPATARPEQLFHQRGQRAEHPVGDRHAHAELAAPDDLSRQVLLQDQLEDVLLDGAVQLQLRRQVNDASASARSNSGTRKIEAPGRWPCARRAAGCSASLSARCRPGARG